MNNKQLHIGCSSYYNYYWKGLFYPEDLPTKKWFEFYCQHFNTYEINGTFYRFPRLKTLQDWYDKAPENFLFSVKVPKLITHIKMFVDCDEQLSEFYDRCAVGLKHKLACILFQLPPSYHYSAEKLESIISKLDSNFKNVIEFRHESWWTAEVWNELEKHNITFCSVSHPKLPETMFTDNPLVYIRLHGNEKMFYSSYDQDKLEQLKNSIVKSNKAKQAFVYFNNTASTAGILNAIEMKEL